MGQPATKKHHGRIRLSSMPDSVVGQQVNGYFLDHPFIRGAGHTSVVLRQEPDGEIETMNSRYKLVTEGEEGRFQTFAMRGEEVIFLNKHGRESERADAIKSGLVEGGKYFVVDISIGNFSSTYEIEFADYSHKKQRKWFNSVMFSVPALTKAEPAPDLLGAYDPTRRIDSQRMQNIEKMISDCISLIERCMPADPRLSDAQMMLSYAKDRVGDHIDNVRASALEFHMDARPVQDRSVS